MRDFVKFLPKFWISQEAKVIKELGMEAQIISLYLLTCPSSTMLGIYYLPIPFIAHETGIPFEEACKALRSLEGIQFCTYDTSKEYVWVHEMAAYQISDQLKPNDNRVKSVNEVFDKLPNLTFLSMFFEKYRDLLLLENPPALTETTEAPLETLQSKEKNKEKEKEKDKKISMSGALKSQALGVLEFLNEKTGRAYRPVETNLKLIMARLKSGATIMDCRQVIAKKTREWKGDAKMAEYLRPATLFNATKFEQYMGELVVPKEELAHER